jgi:catechol 2,3-dioxygenase-like lactoylglutathione lyase family enzyme
MAVRALLHYALEVPDQTVGEKFYRRFGLVDEPTTGGNAVRLRPSPLARNAVLLYGGPKKRLHHLAFGAPGDEFEATRESLRRAGVREVDPPRGAPEGGVWVRDPDENAINVRPEAIITTWPSSPPRARASTMVRSRSATSTRSRWARGRCSPPGGSQRGDSVVT